MAAVKVPFADPHTRVPILELQSVYVDQSRMIERDGGDMRGAIVVCCSEVGCPKAL